MLIRDWRETDEIGIHCAPFGPRGGAGRAEQTLCPVKVDHHHFGAIVLAHSRS
jgi:hypothetical protein